MFGIHHLRTSVELKYAERRFNGVINECIYSGIIKSSYEGIEFSLSVVEGSVYSDMFELLFEESELVNDEFELSVRS